MVGTTLNHYRIVRALGSGGMGEVYEAEDAKLHRRVALKVLAPTIADNPELRQRFEREARAIAALNHRNIVTIHSIEESAGHLFLTMELVDGLPLSRVIAGRPVELARLIELALPIADALGAAHRQGVVHRDLKPDNIMVTGEGVAKILDFGLAQLAPVSHEADAVTMLRTEPLTGDRRIIGTVAYMSPEQAQGLTVDSRSDIFSFGIVLFEMATGRRPFTGESPMATLSSIVKDSAPPVDALIPDAPAELTRIVRRCLAKDPSRRYQTATDIRNDLEELRDDPQRAGSAAAQPAARPGASRTREVIAWSLAAVMLVAALVLFWRPRAIVDPANDVFSILSPEKTTLTDGEAPQVSPDGQMVAFIATNDAGKTLLYVRDRGAVGARALAETDDATMPFWSPDSRTLGFFAGGSLKTVPVSGGRPQVLAPAPVPRGGTWGSDGAIVFVPFPEQPPHRVLATGGSATALPIETSIRRWSPSLLPDGRHYLYLAFAKGQPAGIYVGSIDRPDSTLLVASSTSAAYADGHLMFRRDDSLVVQRLNAGTRQLEGPVRVLADQVTFNPITQQTLASSSSTGVLAYLRSGHVWQLTWFDRLGRRLSQAGTIGGYNSLCLSSDGTHVVFDLADTKTGNVDLWSLNLSDGKSARLTFHQGDDFYVACSPSTDEVVFSSDRSGTPDLYRLRASSPGNEEPVGDASPRPRLPSQWSRDGRHLTYSAFSPGTDFDIWILPFATGKPIALASTDAAEKAAQMSADGRWVAYSAGQRGHDEVYVQPFPATGARWQVSQGGGHQPQWRPDGKQLFYISPDKKLIAVDVDGATSRFAVGASRVLVDTRVGGWERTHLGNPYAVSADGERLLVANAGDQTLPITVLLNWRSITSGGRD